jgi:hypothetical protein
MNDIAKTERLLRTYLDERPTGDGAGLHATTLDAALEAMRDTRQHAIRPGSWTWRGIATGTPARFAAAVCAVAVVSLMIVHSLTEPAWALEEAIEALKGFHAVHIEGAVPGGRAEIWMRANAAANNSTDAVVRYGHGSVIWIQSGATYHYEPDQKTVYFERALTVGLSQWLGPELLDTLSTADNARVVYGKDPETGRDRVMLLCSVVDVNGPQSFVVEFDRASKLPVAIKQWQNLDRSGPPAFDAFNITYYESLPDEVFHVRLPGDVQYVEKPLQIPDAAVGALGNPRDGFPAQGMTQQDAAERAVRTLYQAVIDQDLGQLKHICPLCRNMGDEFLRAIIFKPDKPTRIVEIVEVGRIRKTGRSSLGPIVALPTIVRLANGKKVEEQMIVQFRQFGDVVSCVVHGPWGLPREIE